MRIEHVSSRPFNKKKSAKRICFTKAFLLSGVFAAAMPFVSSAQNITPNALNGQTQSRTVCSGLNTDVSDWLKVFDPDVIPTPQTLTWTIVVPPSNGSLSGNGTIASAGGSSSIPLEMTYTPDPGATSDAFTVIVDDGNGGSVPISVTVSINSGPSIALGSITPVCSGVSMASIPFSDLQNVGPDTMQFTFTGGSQSWNVPDFVTSVKFDLMGASGGHDSYIGTGTPGKGGRVQGTMTVTPGVQLNVFVGGAGSDGVIAPGTAMGGFNGGGNATFSFYGSGGAGGGATDIRVGGLALTNRKAVAGGGGGNGAEATTVYGGGNGGGLVGGSSIPNVAGSSAKGGTQALGGAPASYIFWPSGSFGSTGQGGNSSSQGISGGGGGGYYGGGGGIWNGGGGGSSYTDPATVSAVSHTQGANTGNGFATLYYTVPGTYSIIWDGAPGNGFENQAGKPLPTAGSSIDFPVPPTAAPGVYHGTVTVNNGNCDSPPYDVYVTIKPKPVVNNPGTMAVCDGSPVADINFTGSAPVASDYHWATTDLAMSGSGHIPSYTPVNGTNFPVTTNFFVYPFVNGCYGDTAYFNVVSNPIPQLLTSLTPASVCNNTVFNYPAASAVAGTSFAWSRDAVTGVDNPAAGGTDNPNEILTNSTNDPVAVAYVYTLTANSCENVQTVNVNVNPTPVLTSSLTPAALCNDAPFVYAPTASAGAASISWSRASVPGISNAANTGMGNINEPLHNTTTAPVAVTYVVTMSIDACNYNQNVVVSVNPPLNLTSATTLAAVCDSIVTSYVPTASVPTAEITWTRAANPSFNNAASSGINGFSETLVNNSNVLANATYEYMMKAFGCVNTQNVTVPVKPRPRLSSTLTPNGICTNMYFDYTATSGVAGTTFIWARDVKAGISNGAMMGAGNVREVLVNVTDLPITVPYIYTGTANGCNHQDTVRVVVNPLPKISNDVSDLAVCDSALFNFTPTSVTPGASYSWSRAYEAGIANLSATGTGNPNERLNNTTYITVPATYVYTVTANGCNNTQNVTVQVRPSAILTKNTAVTCSGAPFTFDPVSYTTGTEFAWSRGSVSGITPATAEGEGSIEDMMTSNSNTAPIVVTYDYELTIEGCTNMQKLTVTVNPAPVPVIATTAPANLNLCNNSMYQNFGAGAPAPAGFAYSWSVSNAILNSVGSNGQFAVVSFTNPGKATVTLTTRNAATGCVSKTNTDVTVSTGSAIIPEVIYFNNQFICKTNTATSYQWGYDDANTMDSVVLAGETNQNYTNQFPDFTNKYYWVITNNNGCVQKTYFNKPTGITDIDAIVVDMKVYPNPARDIVNVEVSASVNGNITMDVFNLMGQKVQTAQAVNNKAQIGIADLPAGAYIVDCYSDGIKVAAARFIKN